MLDLLEQTQPAGMARGMATQMRMPWRGNKGMRPVREFSSDGFLSDAFSKQLELVIT